MKVVYFLPVLFVSAEIPKYDGLPYDNKEEKLINKLLDKKKYSPLVRPVREVHDVVNINFTLILSQLISLEEYEQFMTAKVWLAQSWFDERLKWNPADHGGIEKVQLPGDEIWRPELVLYNNADGSYESTFMAMAIVYFNGSVEWTPPAVFHSSCGIRVRHFPFDIQLCPMEFQSWVFSKKEVQIQLTVSKHGSLQAIRNDFTDSGEWAIIGLPARKTTTENDKMDKVRFDIVMKRKPLFYTVNLIVPCILITSLAIFVFVLPSESGEKMSLCISVLLALTVFLLLISKLIPPTSLDVPLIGRFLIFTMVLVTSSIVASVCVLNIHYRSPQTHDMPKWLRHVFLQVLPKYIFFRRNLNFKIDEANVDNKMSWKHSEAKVPSDSSTEESTTEALQGERNSTLASLQGSIRAALMEMSFIGDCIRHHEAAKAVATEWQYVAMVLDRLLLWIFLLVTFFGTIFIFLSPLIYPDIVVCEEGGKQKASYLGYADCAPILVLDEILT
ncbi:Oidioi.mRNA.OKI2018_I69.chr2.g6044.t1.cds [Oikopleura dioica]|uniref:Oidioi.mRNA.OKI2018_I69.chr2.g6044.t1.cds n=1 Tax=Oikopleura dioica TaxID=34765 RepID=A0ABN7T1R1_OIKDI|nr:Oidioi.mRNA.OKI2018_I69.chr2.g6044.t1.cds [Oikopleura dioica]